ncbi:unnamed protein product [Camellia sinensis]
MLLRCIFFAERERERERGMAFHLSSTVVASLAFQVCSLYSLKHSHLRSVGFHVKSGLENESNVSNPSSEPINMEGSQTQTSRQNCLKCLCLTIALLNISSSISGPKAAIALDGKERPVCQTVVVVVL